MSEVYALIRNLDKSVLKINPYLKKFRLEFKCYNLIECEDKLAAVFGTWYARDRLNKEIKTMGMTIGSYQISHEFYDAIYKSPLKYEPTRNSGYLVALTNTEELLKETYDECMDELQKFILELIQKLRVYKEGDISFFKLQGMGFEDGPSAIGLTSFESNLMKMSKYKVEDEEVSDLLVFLEETDVNNSLCSLAIKTLGITYNISDRSVEFVTLMTAIESLFNRGPDQITQTVSRHLSLIISSNREEFIENYTMIKKLYHMRSRIVHGEQVENDDLVENIKVLSNLVRKAIRYCLEFKINIDPELKKQKQIKPKDQLFNHLNSLGYGN